MTLNKNSAKNQYFAALCVNILSLSYGAFCGWPSSSFLVLQSKDSPLEGGPMTDEQASWVGSILCIGGLFGNILFGYLANKYGKKIGILCIAVPSILSYVLIIFASSVEHLILSRFVGGLGGGGVFSVIPLYVTEIAEDRVRGTLGSYLVLTWNIGLLIAYIVGSCIDYKWFPYVLIIFPSVFVMLFPFLPETPSQLFKVNKVKEAEISLRYYRNIRSNSEESIPEDFACELKKLKEDCVRDDDSKTENETSLSLADFTTKPTIKALIFGLGLIALNQFCGCFALLNYTATIFVKAGSTLPPNISAIIVAVIQLFGSYFSVILVDRMGRKALICGSAFGAGLGFICMGTYLLMDLLPGHDVSDYKWIPLACFSFIIFIASWGVLTLPFLLISELCPPKIRGTISGTCVTMLWIFAFGLIKYLTEIIDTLGMHGAMYFFAASCFIGGLFVLAFVPETKGRSIDEIMALLE